MSTGVTTCEPCRRKGKEVTAAKWCVECDEALCPECCDAHRTMKALLTHRVVDIDIAKTASTSGTLARLKFSPGTPVFPAKYN
jgi:hypothetical protein